MPQTIADVEQIIDSHWRLLNNWFDNSDQTAVIEFVEVINSKDLDRFVHMVAEFPGRAQMVKNFCTITLYEYILRHRLKLASE